MIVPWDNSSKYLIDLWTNVSQSETPCIVYACLVFAHSCSIDKEVTSANLYFCHLAGWYMGPQWIYTVQINHNRSCWWSFHQKSTISTIRGFFVYSGYDEYKNMSVVVRQGWICMSIGRRTCHVDALDCTTHDDVYYWFLIILPVKLTEIFIYFEKWNALHSFLLPSYDYNLSEDSFRVGIQL